MKKSLFLTVLLITIMQAVNAQWLVHGTAPDYTPYYIGTNGIGGPGTVGTNQPPLWRRSPDLCLLVT
jgi:hypothetical protein